MDSTYMRGLAAKIVTRTAAYASFEDKINEAERIFNESQVVKSNARVEELEKMQRDDAARITNLSDQIKAANNTSLEFRTKLDKAEEIHEKYHQELIKANQTIVARDEKLRQLSDELTEARTQQTTNFANFEAAVKECEGYKRVEQTHIARIRDLEAACERLNHELAKVEAASLDAYSLPEAEYRRRILDVSARVKASEDHRVKETNKLRRELEQAEIEIVNLRARIRTIEFDQATAEAIPETRWYPRPKNPETAAAYDEAHGVLAEAVLAADGKAANTPRGFTESVADLFRDAPSPRYDVPPLFAGPFDYRSVKAWAYDGHNGNRGTLVIVSAIEG